MLKINEEQIDVFTRVHNNRLRSNLNRLLVSEIPDWRVLKSGQKAQWLDFLITKANEVPLVSYSEYMIFSLACMSSKEGCLDFLEREDVKITLLDKFISNERKMSLLTDFSKTNAQEF